MRALELLSPAKDIETGIIAINNGADAVYIGAPHHGARQAASNSVEDISRLVNYAHRYRAKVYVTLNTLIYDSEVSEVESLVNELYSAGVDALIVQDMAFLEMKLPPIPLHASTQCDIRTPEKARFLQDAGFSQLVLARELSLQDISEVRNATSVPLEAFVHGALCVCYSGDCRASFLRGGRSANRGECAQVCRLPFDLTDDSGNHIIKDKHLLSLRDMNRIDYLSQMIEAGISSFKIEGRLKSKEYVANVTRAYSQALDSFIKANPGKYRRSSFGTVESIFQPDLNNTFNRGYTPYFLHNTNPGANSLASFATPKHVGIPVAKVLSADAKKIIVNSGDKLNNGDGLGYWKDGSFIGFRANKVENNVIRLATGLATPPPKGAIVYRNYDKKFIDDINRNPSERYIALSMTLSKFPGGIALKLEDERGCRITQTLQTPVDVAQKPQTETRKKIMAKTGDTIYRVISFKDELDAMDFVPASVLTGFRREAINILDDAAEATYPFEYRVSKPDILIKYPKDTADFHDNISNSLSRNFYENLGVRVLEGAIEVSDKGTDNKEVLVMQCRYCLRRELGECLKDKGNKALRGPLYLNAKDGKSRYRLDFDCANCRMNVISLPPTSSQSI